MICSKAFFRSAEKGVFFHYLAFECEAAGIYSGKDMSPEKWNALADAFDERTLARQISGAGFRYCVLTTGQNSGYYLAPNSVYESLVPRGKGESRLARRDVVAALAEALAEYGIPLFAYLPSEAPEKDSFAREALGSGRTFRGNWENIIREWSLRWGGRIAGWWFDGVYHPENYAGPDANFHTLASAARAGNRESLLAFNHGVHYPFVNVADEDDYSAGEVNEPWRAIAAFRRDPGRIPHMLTFSGSGWGVGPLRFSAGELAAATRAFNLRGGPVTWDIPIRRDGTIEPEILRTFADADSILRTAPPSALLPSDEPVVESPAIRSDRTGECASGRFRLGGKSFEYTAEEPFYTVECGRFERRLELPVRETVHGGAEHLSAGTFAEISFRREGESLRFEAVIDDPDRIVSPIRWDASSLEIRQRDSSGGAVKYIVTPDGVSTPSNPGFRILSSGGSWTVSGTLPALPELEFRVTVIRGPRAYSIFLFGGEWERFVRIV